MNKVKELEKLRKDLLNKPYVNEQKIQSIDMMLAEIKQKLDNE